MIKKHLIALILSFNTLLVAQSNDISKDSMRALIDQGLKSLTNSNTYKAIDEFTIAWEYGKINKEMTIAKRAANGLALAYIELDNLEKANEYYNFSLNADSTKVLADYNYSSLIADYNNLGLMYELKQDTIEAIKHYDSARRLCMKSKDTFRIVWADVNIAMLKYGQRKYDEATFHFKEALKNFIPNSYHQPEIFIDCNIYLARINSRHKKYELSNHYLEKADSSALILENYEALFNAEKIRYDIYNETNQLLKAKSSLEKQIEYFSIDKKKQEEKLIENSKLEQKLLDRERTLEFSNKINETQKKALRKNKLFSYITLFFLGITCIILYLLQRSNHTRKKLNKDLTTKNKDLLDAKEKTEYASRLKENFFSTISHELRTPLYAVTGITDILIDDNPKNEHVHYLKTLKSSGEHLLGLINNILQINKFDTSKIEINMVDFNIRSLIETIKESLNYLKSENNNTIHIEVDESIPNTLQGDSLKITQIIVNLLSNSLKFTKNGNIWIIVECVEKTEETVILDIRVKDDGIGISKDMQAQIFEDFYQESMQLDRNYEGTGLGLAIVKRLLDAMGSEIKVKSNTKEGATFYFSLKLNIKEQISIPKQETKGSIDFKGNHFLVVDDNAINLMITKRILESKNADVTIAKNGFEAIEKIKTKTFGVVLMDIHMPNMNGYTATKKIREFDKTTPIIALTAVTLDDNKDKITDSGMNGVIIKPFVIEIFFDKIKEFL